MSLGSPSQCPKCGTAIAGDAVYCPNCGEARVQLASKSNTGQVILMAVIGVIAAFPVWLFLGTMGIGLFAGLGAGKSSPWNEFSMSLGTIGYFLFLTLAALIGLIVVAQRRMSPTLRAFAIAFLGVAFGLFSICDIVAISSRG
jgi:predicted nucleic acid-binding Zn ribbon protein